MPNNQPLDKTVYWGHKTINSSERKETRQLVLHPVTYTLLHIFYIATYIAYIATYISYGTVWNAIPRGNFSL